MTAQENAVIVSKRLSLDPGKNIGNIGVQPLKGHITKAAVAFAVAVKVKPHAADALHSQGAGHLGEHRLIAAAGAAEAMQHNQHGKRRAAVRQGYDAAQSMPGAVLKICLNDLHKLLLFEKSFVYNCIIRSFFAKT